MGYAVYHLEKGNISSGGIGNHIDRTEGKEHTYKHADPELKGLNKNYLLNEHCKKNLAVAISDRIKEGYSSKNKAGQLKEIRKDAVKYTTHILTGSHEDMKAIEADPAKLESWAKANADFLANEFGKENIVRFVLHRDEKTPHIHAVTVNLTKDGRLSAKEIIGNRKQMQLRQDRYAEAMKNFGLQRGEKREGITHEDAKEYYARMKKALEVNPVITSEAKKTVLGVEVGIDKDKTIENLKRAVMAEKTANKSKDFTIQEIKQTAEKADSLAKLYKKQMAEAQKEKSALIGDRNVYEERREKAVFTFMQKEFLPLLRKNLDHSIINGPKKMNAEQIRELSQYILKEMGKEHLRLEVQKEFTENRLVQQEMVKITEVAVEKFVPKEVAPKVQLSAPEQQKENDYGRFDKAEENRRKNEEKSRDEDRSFGW